MAHRIRFLDALRGLAVLVVFAQHCVERMIHFGVLQGLQPAAEAIFVATCNFGRLGVALFFIISGYVVPFSFKGDTPVRGFAISRFFRLYPAYWLSIVFMLLIELFREPERLPTVTAALANVTMLQQFMGQPDVIGVYWTLAIEMMFYGICAVLFIMGLLNRTIPTALAVCALLVGASLVGIMSYVMDHHWPANILLNLGFMFLGTMFRRSSADLDPMARRLMPFLLLFTVIVVPLVQFTSYPLINRDDPLIQPQAFASAYLAALAIFTLSIRYWPDRHTFFDDLGKISYSFYLFHGAIIFAVEPIMLLAFPGASVLFLVVAAGLTIVVSALVFQYIEKPSAELGRKVRRGSVRGVAAAKSNA